MKGAIIGDIVGSVYEHHNIKHKDFDPLFSPDAFFTDDSVMTIAVGTALKEFEHSPFDMLIPRVTAHMQVFGQAYPGRGYGGRFKRWLYEENAQPYNSWGNGAPMRCSAAGWLAEDYEDTLTLADTTALPSHTHDESLKAVRCTAAMIWAARQGRDMDELRTYAETRYEIPVLDEIRPTYSFDVSSQGTMPVALAAFLESSDFEDAIRLAVSVGGDSDTIAAITGSISEAFYGVPVALWEKAKTYLDAPLLECVDKFYAYLAQKEAKRA